MASSKWFEQREKEFSALYRDFEKQYQASGPSREVWQAMSDEEKATVRQNLAPLRARATALAQERDEMHRLSQSRLTRFSIHANRRSEYYYERLTEELRAVYEPLADEAELDQHNDRVFAEFGIEPAKEPANSKVGRYWLARQTPETPAPVDTGAALTLPVPEPTIHETPHETPAAKAPQTVFVLPASYTIEQGDDGRWVIIHNGQVMLKNGAMRARSYAHKSSARRWLKKHLSAEPNN